MAIIMQEILSQSKSLPDAGQILFENISQADERNTKLVVDMSQTTSLPSIFLNASIGRFIDARGKERLKETLTFTNITKAQATRLREYLDHYKAIESGESFSGENRGTKEYQIR
jgi:hypothetical protein